MPTLLERLVEVGSVRFGEFVLTSGKVSPYYIDIKRALTEPDVLRAIGREMGRRYLGEDLLGGVELGAVPLAAAVSLETGAPYVIVRKGKRAHGTAHKVEGPDVEGRTVLLVEDVVTTGGSVAGGIATLREMGATVSRVVCVVDRGEGGTEILREKGVVLEALLGAEEILEVIG
ncbi:MAG TPA: orotate phosphoribosyltransferase [Thermoplasmata archaeon]|nr:orotate phosphoribosyltransferase [Thermoplasmata archaeon]